jgi:hypothetical protein
MSFKPEVQTGPDPKFYGNNLRFMTREEAERNVYDLMMRWYLVRETRVVECDDPPNYMWVGHELKEIETPMGA